MCLYVCLLYVFRSVCVSACAYSVIVIHEEPVGTCLVSRGIHIHTYIHHLSHSPQCSHVYSAPDWALCRPGPSARSQAHVRSATPCPGTVMTIALWKEGGGRDWESWNISRHNHTHTIPRADVSPCPLIIHVPLVLVCLLSHLSFSFWLFLHIFLGPRRSPFTLFLKLELLSYALDYISELVLISWMWFLQRKLI